MSMRRQRGCAFTVAAATALKQRQAQAQQLQQRKAAAAERRAHHGRQALEALRLEDARHDRLLHRVVVNAKYCGICCVFMGVFYRLRAADALLGPCKDALDAREELIAAEGLADVVVRTQVQALRGRAGALRSGNGR